MKIFYKTLIATLISITLMLSLGSNMSQARSHPSSSLDSTMSSSSQAHFHSLFPGRKRANTTDPVVASLRRIPPSLPNPTQNKLKPRPMG
ncbi:Clavata3/ESR (CLE) protein [Quillaja saponaria]|uniref:Clavata3/ESR (CLE) protein n=1 Tax=Quillaja saponaria TaxID=32244 RepID=A0AAD7QJ33_QUISA|nr:Clavata3/ESR (CLE) protein [Quillaja saponaria]